MTQHGVTGEMALPPPVRQPYDSRDLMVLGIAAAAAAVSALASSLAGLPRFQAFTGLFVILGIAYAFSTNRRAIDRRTVAWGLGLQIVFALFVLKTDVGRRIFTTLAGVINRLLAFSFEGSSMVFGPLGSKEAWPDIMNRVLGPDGARVGRGLRVPGAADDHLHRGAVCHPLLLRHHAVRGPGVRHHDAARDAGERRRVAERGGEHFHGTD
jgi:hypothetical protein